MSQDNNANLKIAWLLPSAFFYWQPAISELARTFPQTTVFTGYWLGFAPGFEDSFAVEVLERKIKEANICIKRAQCFPKLRNIVGLQPVLSLAKFKTRT
jgi:hypothetical protein